MSAPQHLPVDSFYLGLTPHTPLVPVTLADGGPSIWCKLEFLNPSGSTKDRIASYILTKAWRAGELGPGSVVVEASSGSTSIAMAMVSAQLGLRFIAVMPEGVSNERSLMIRAYGGEVVLSPREDGVVGSIRVSREIAQREGGYLPRQFENMENAQAHRLYTAREIVTQMPGECVDAVVSGVGTGGTLVGLYLGLRDHGCEAKPFAARPVSRAGEPAARVGCFHDAEHCSYSSCIPGVMDNMSKIYRPEELPGLVEVEVDDRLAVDMTRALIGRGFPVGPSSGLNYAAAVEAARQLPPDAKVVTVFCDRMERYFSTELFTGMASGKAGTC
jgi:cysteine synthase A